MQTTSLVIACTRPCANMPLSSCERLARRMWSNFVVPNTTYPGISEPCRKGAIGSSRGSKGWATGKETTPPPSPHALNSHNNQEELVFPPFLGGVLVHHAPPREGGGSVGCSRPCVR